MKRNTEFGHFNRGDMLTSEQHWCPDEKFWSVDHPQFQKISLAGDNPDQTPHDQLCLNIQVNLGT